MSTAPELAAAAEAILALWQKQGLDSSSSLAMAEAAIGGYRAYLAALREAPVAVKALECPGADDPEERCPKPPHECTCWQVELDYHPKRIRSALTASPASHGVVTDAPDPYQEIELGEHQEVLAALAAHNSGEE